MTKLPLWSELPDIDLYLDQVLVWVNRIGAPYDCEPLTAAMINNYVKHRYVPKPHKKKYTREQIATLLQITLLKRAFALTDIAQMLRLSRDHAAHEGTYQQFVAAWETAHANERVQPLGTGVPALLHHACQTVAQHRQATKWLAHLSQKEVLKDDCDAP